MMAVAPAKAGTAGGRGHALQALEPLSRAEVVAVVGAVMLIYGGILGAIHCLADSPTGASADHPGYWGTLPSAWDHPEPNYVVSAGIGEFWSVLTTIPLAGAVLLYEGLKYNYGGKVICIYALICIMYSLAFTAHLTLQKLIFSSTVVAVMSNALLTFAQFSYVVHRWLESKVLRGCVVGVAEVVLVVTVATLPYALSAHGGVWTLFTVQSPGVFLATGLAGGLARAAKSPQERSTYRVVCTAGFLLSAAMFLSLVECLVGFDYGFLPRLWGFPWLHIAIHVFEQVGIYLFGVGLAALQTLLLLPASRPGAELRCLGPCLIYFYCPKAREGLSELPTSPMKADPPEAAEEEDNTRRKAMPSKVPEEPPTGEQVPRGRPSAPGVGEENGLLRNRRVRSPGVVAPRP
mmetsp:Transcript_25764/g.76905  ORF Transcript_25764/g.76905 Transcript_25764/m.76905 type:complete len:405 (+) Transcript_25764:134-1348(+)